MNKRRSNIPTRLVGHRLRRCLDTLDIGQSTPAGSFHVASLRCTLRPTGEAKRLLVTMVLYKLIREIRGEAAPPNPLARGREAAAPGPTPAERVADRDRLRAIHDPLSECEQQFLERRAEGSSLREPAGEYGGAADVVRRLHARAFARIRREFLGAR